MERDRLRRSYVVVRRRKDDAHRYVQRAAAAVGNIKESVRRPRDRVRLGAGAGACHPRVAVGRP